MAENRNPDDLLKTSPEGSIELSEEQLDAAAGGRAKTADKAQEAVDKYIKG